MSDAEISGTTSDVAGKGAASFPSLAALHAAHVELLRRQRESGGAPGLIADLDDFIQRGSATGVLLDSDADRETAQGLLDYWATILLRTGHEPPDATLADFDAELAPELDAALCPYVGLDSFRESESGVFFGRQRLIAELVERLKEHRLLAVIGPSGSGKSSVVRAGLIPALQNDGLPDSASWRALPPIVPGADPLRSLARPLRPAGAPAGWLAEQVERFKQDRGHLARLLAESGVATAILTVDQFEEVFTLTEEEAARRGFIHNLLYLVDAPDAEHTVIVTMRTDFEPLVARAPELQARFAEGRVPVTPLSAAELREAIEKPAALVGLKFEDGVVDALLQDILGEPAALPLLQFTLLKLWEHRQRNRVTMEAYRRLGGGRLALARSADEFYNGLIPEEQVTARRILMRMVRPGEGLEVTSNRVRRASLYQGGEDPGRVDRVVEKLIQARLVRVTGGDTPEDAQIEVAHEALVRNWPTLVGWLEDERAALAARRRLEAKAAEWVRLGRGGSGLLDREQLLDAEHWLDSPEAEYLGFDPALPELVAFSRAAIEEAEAAQEVARQRELAQARALAEAERHRAEAERHRAELEERTNRRLTWLFRALAVMAIIAGLAAILAVYQAVVAIGAQVRAESNARQLETANAVAETNARVANENARVADQNRLTAEKNADVARANAATAQTAEAISNDLRNKEAERRRAERAELLGAVAQAVATDKPQLSLLLGVEGLRVREDADEPPVDTVTRALSQTLIGMGAPTRGLYGHPAKVVAVAIGARGDRMLSGDASGVVRFWDLAAGDPTAQPIALPGTTAPIDALAFTPDDRLLIAAGEDGVVHVWGTNGQATPRDLSGLKGPIGHLIVSPSGRWLAASGDDSQAYVWNLANLDAAPIRLSGHRGQVTGLAISGDSRLVMTSSADGTAHLYDLSANNPARPSGLLVPRPNAPALSDAAISPNGRWAVTAAQDGALHVWTVSGNAFGAGPTILSAGTVTALAIDPGSRWVVAGGGDGAIRLWRLGSRAPQFTLTGHASPVTAIAFSSDGRWMATTSVDGTARVWDLNDPAAPPRVLRGHEGPVNAAALAADGGRLATGGEDTSARDWDLAAPAPSADALPKDAPALAALACRSAGRELADAEWAQYFAGQPRTRQTCGSGQNK